MARLIRLERKDGIVQRYRTTESSLVKKGYVRMSRRIDSREYIVWSRPREPVPVPPAPEVPEEASVSEPVAEEAPEGLYEVVVYTEYKQARRGYSERYELRTCVSARSEEEASEKALRKMSSVVPDDYLVFLDAIGIFGPDVSEGVHRISVPSSYRGVKYFRFHAGGVHPHEPSARFGE